jgi:Ig-like domain-containing protein/PKD domain-containing protein/immunoglobulin I-set domain protein
MSSIVRALLRGLMASLVLLALGPLSSAAAEGEPELELFAPQITHNPSSTSVAAGSQATFTASASGATEVQWEVSTNGGGSFAADTSDAGNNTETLTVASTAAMNGYQYRAVFGNPLGHAETSPATLTVVSPPTITANPVSESVEAGKTATFSAAATGADSVQWQYWSGSEWKAVPPGSGTSDIYSFTAQTVINGVRLDGLQLRALFTNAAGETPTAPATLSVGTAPQITSSPTSVSAAAGSTVSFTAGASGEPTPTVQWKVSSNGGGSWSSVSGANSNTLSLTATQDKSGYEYRAVFTNKWASSETAPATLTVYTAPVMTQQPTSLSVVAGEPATFTAAASGTPTPTVQWEVFTSANPEWTAVATSPTLTILHTPPTYNDRLYRATFRNIGGFVNSTGVMLTVATHSEPPTITSQPGDVRVKAGESATFSAHAGGVPTPHVQWEVSTDLGSNWSQDTTDPGNSTEAITVAASSGQNGYQYRAVFSSTAGSAITAPATLIVESPPAGSSASPAASSPGNPKASFAWFPLAPRAGEAVSLVSSSTDTTGAITAFAWDTTGSGTFVPGGPVLTTSFSTAGNHLVRLRVTDASGLSSVVTETISVGAPRAIVMQPFPIVRIAGFDTAFGADLSLLSAQAPHGARITLRCLGRGCPVKQEVRVVASSRGKGVVLFAFRRFERSLKAGIVLQIRIWKAGQIGKYTSFTIRRHKLPLRVDACLDPAGYKPIACPSS